MAKRKTAAPAPASRVWKKLPIDQWLLFFGKTQTWLAEQTGYDESYVSLLIAGKKRYNQDVIEAVARALGIPDAMLFSPPASQDFWTLYNELSENDRRAAAAIVRGLRDSRS